MSSITRPRYASTATFLWTAFSTVLSGIAGGGGASSPDFWRLTSTTVVAAMRDLAVNWKNGLRQRKRRLGDWLSTLAEDCGPAGRFQSVPNAFLFLRIPHSIVK